MNFLKKVIKVNILILFVFITLLSDISAQSISRIGFSISPPIIEKSADPGETFSGTIKVENFNQDEISLDAKITNFKSIGDKGQVQITDEDVNYSAKDWITIIKKTQSIAKGDLGYFDYTVEVPVGTPPGGYTAAILVTFKGTTNVNPLSSTQTNAKILQEIASIFIIQIPGESEEGIIIKEFAPLLRVFFYPKIKLYSLVENTGNTHQKPYGNIVIKDVFGNTIKTVDVFGKNVLRQTRRLYEEEFEFENIGIFTAEINLNYGNLLKQNVSATTYFISLNIERIILVVLVILLLFLLIRVGRKYIRINIGLKKPVSKK